MKRDDVIAHRRYVAVILAGGSGKRTGGGLPKQFWNMAGRSVIERAVDAFEQNRRVREIVIVSRVDELSMVEELVSKNEWRKVARVVAGGEERFDSSLAAIRLYEDPATCLLLHDAARPLVSQRVIDAVMDALEVHDAVAVGLPVVDTLFRVAGGEVIEVPERTSLVRAQTPQAFVLSTIREAYERALADPCFRATDDCGVVKRYLPDVRIHVVPGEEANMKLTYPEDIFLLESYLRRQEGVSKVGFRPCDPRSGKQSSNP
ncbi:MAG: 2-C-methyl-D-erythritol 4-phosphate cytidylyltransferase [Odoribacteraceae bacterium]|jgi:2-C-methyl-D-erythritol 4-phosphate cytidylyltransferase|nr:2-C-methyl-D-erythritol 4-phosphate cytidylyltransferase [Odoribacteraceae bacterium]